MPIGDCGAPFPPPDASIFVDDDYGPGDLDATHFATLTEALAAAPSGATIAVEAGTYAEVLVPTKPVTIAGRCAEQVIVLAEGTGDSGVLVSGLQNVVLRGITVQGGTPGIVAIAGGAVTVEACLVFESHDVGLLAEGSGSLLSARDTAVRSTLPSQNPLVAWGAASQAGAELELERVVLADHRYVGLAVADGARATLASSIVRDVSPVAGDSGAGIVVDGADLEADGLLVLDVAANGIVAQHSNTSFNPPSITLRSSVVHGTKLSPGITAGSGVRATGGATVTIEDGDIAHNDQCGLFADGAGTAIALTRTVVRNGQPDAGGEFGLGLAAYNGASLAIEDSALVDNRAYGIQLSLSATATVARSLVQNTALDGDLGRGIDVQLGGKLDLSDSALVSNSTFGIAVYGEADDGTRAEATITRTLVTDSQSLPEGVPGPGGLDWFGRGAAVWDGGRVEIRESALLGNREVGFFVSPSPGNVTGSPSEGVLSASIVRGTLPTPGGTGGVGVYSAGRLAVDSSTIVDSTAAGVLVIGSEASVTDCFVRSTHEWAAEDAFGHGVVATQGARLFLVRTEISQSERIGVAFGGASGVVEGCRIRANQIGIHAQEGSLLLDVDAPPAMLGPLDVAVTRDTSFVDNTTRVGSGVIPLPSTLGTGP